MKTSTLSQVAQIITNLEHFEIACAELERSLKALRYAAPHNITHNPPLVSRHTFKLPSSSP